MEIPRTRKGTAPPKRSTADSNTFHDWGPTSQLVREAFVGAYCDQAPLTNAEQDQLQSGIEAIMKHFGWA
jgi:hypothetical protein